MTSRAPDRRWPMRPFDRVRHPDEVNDVVVAGPFSPDPQPPPVSMPGGTWTPRDGTELDRVRESLGCSAQVRAETYRHEGRGLTVLTTYEPGDVWHLVVWADHGLPTLDERDFVHLAFGLVHLFTGIEDHTVRAPSGRQCIYDTEECALDNAWWIQFRTRRYGPPLSAPSASTRSIGRDPDFAIHAPAVILLTVFALVLAIACYLFLP